MRRMKKRWKEEMDRGKQKVKSRTKPGKGDGVSNRGSQRVKLGSWLVCGSNMLKLGILVFLPNSKNLTSSNDHGLKNCLLWGEKCAPLGQFICGKLNSLGDSLRLKAFGMWLDQEGRSLINTVKYLEIKEDQVNLFCFFIMCGHRQEVNYLWISPYTTGDLLGYWFSLPDLQTKKKLPSEWKCYSHLRGLIHFWINFF